MFQIKVVAAVSSCGFQSWACCCFLMPECTVCMCVIRHLMFCFRHAGSTAGAAAGPPITQSATDNVRLLCCCIMQAAVGGRMRLFISGGAPLPKYAGDFMVTAMNVPVLQVGWVLTCLLWVLLVV